VTTDDTFIRFNTTHERDRQTDTHTQTDTVWQHRPRLCISSRGKNKMSAVLVLWTGGWPFDPVSVLHKRFAYLLKDYK